MKWPGLLLPLIMLAPPAFAQFEQRGDPQAAAAPAPRYKGVMQDFRIIHFQCVGDRGDYLIANLCASAESAVGELAHQQRLKVKSAGREDDDGFTLTVRVRSSGKLPRAVSVRVDATRLYEGATDLVSRVYPAATPRAGKLVFWERDIIAASSSTGDSLDYAMRSSVRGLLKNFFVWYRGQR